MIKMSEETASRTVIITGAAGGIGRVMVQALLADGHRVGAVDRDTDALQALREDEGSPAALTVMTADLCKADEPERVVRALRDVQGPADAVVNNAGIGGSGFWQRLGKPRPVFWELDPEVWDQYMQVNATAVFRLSRAAAPDLIRSGRGRLINVTTSLISMLERKMAPYGPSKAATEALTANMAADLDGTGATANVLIPGGPTDTAMVVGVDKKRLLAPEIMVPPLLWLLSDSAAETTGRRFIAHRWDLSVSPDEAARGASDPVAWTELAQKSGRVGNAADLIYQDARITP
jgi:NAD(P)-dependent dehydrogenase (short-subunit alcohol dehydrogenase family)